jgi:hypothetical protein
MSYEMLESPVELAGTELDAVAAGQQRGPNQSATDGLVNANVNVQDVQVGVAAQVLGRNLDFAQGTGG